MKGRAQVRPPSPRQQIVTGPIVTDCILMSRAQTRQKKNNTVTTAFAGRLLPLAPHFNHNPTPLLFPQPSVHHQYPIHRSQRSSKMKLPTITLFLLSTTSSSSSSSHHAATRTPTLAFTTTQSHRPPLRKRALAQSLLKAMPTKHHSESRSEFSRRSLDNSHRPSSSPTTSLSPPSPQTTTTTTSSLSMILPDSQQQQQQAFEIHLGRAIDTLRTDYPTLLTHNPDWKIYSDDIEVIDPSGVKMSGLGNYRRAFYFVHGVVSWFYCGERSGLTSVRVAYDWARKCIR